MVAITALAVRNGRDFGRYLWGSMQILEEGPWVVESSECVKSGGIAVGGGTLFDAAMTPQAVFRHL